MDYRPPAAAIDASAADWIATRLLDGFGAVCTTIPTGFDAYARVLHPADPGSGTPLRWAEVADATGRSMHALAQFDRIATTHPAVRARQDAATDVQPPETGDLAPGELAALCRIVQAHTPDGMRCWFALRQGRGELTGAVAHWHTLSGAAGAPPSAPSEWQLDVRTAARFELPGRAYYLFTGSLEETLRFGYWSAADWFLPRSPNLFWPNDRRWCVASEIDFDSTLVGGTTALINDILDSDDLEAWPVNPHDSLAFDGDSVNER